MAGNKINNTGYLPGTSTENNPYNIIPSNNITMEGVNQPLLAIPNNGTPQVMLPNNNYNFPDSQYVTEIPLAKKGKKLRNKQAGGKVQYYEGETPSAFVSDSYESLQAERIRLQNQLKNNDIPLLKTKRDVQQELNQVNTWLDNTKSFDDYRAYVDGLGIGLQPNMDEYGRPLESKQRGGRVSVSYLGAGDNTGLTQAQINALAGNPVTQQDVTPQPIPTADYRDLPNTPQWVKEAPQSEFTKRYKSSGRWNSDGSYTPGQYYVGPNYSGHNFTGSTSQSDPVPIEAIAPHGSAYHQQPSGAISVNTNRVFQNGGNMTPYIPEYYRQQNNIQPFNYGNMGDYAGYANAPQNYDLGANFDQGYGTQAQPIQQSQPQSQQNFGSTGSAIQQGAMAIGDIARGINSFQNQLVVGGGAILNSLIPEIHNRRVRSPQLTDSTFSYPQQYNNMYQNGGGIPTEPQVAPITAYLPGEEVELTPEQVEQLRQAGYEFDII